MTSTVVSMAIAVVLIWTLATLLRSSYGQSTVETMGRSITISVDGRPEMKHAGVTIDWSTVAAVSGSDVTTLDGVLIRIGEKYLRYGQVICQITATGKYGPYDPGAADGRQLIARELSYIILKTMKEDEISSDHPPACFGGQLFKSRVLQTGVAAHTLAGGPTLAEVQAAFPRAFFAPD